MRILVQFHLHQPRHLPLGHNHRFNLLMCCGQVGVYGLFGHFCLFKLRIRA